MEGGAARGRNKPKRFQVQAFDLYEQIFQYTTVEEQTIFMKPVHHNVEL